LHVGLLQERVFLEKLIEFSSCDFFQYLLWLTFLTSLLLTDLDFFLYHTLIHGILIQCNGFHRSNLHSYVFPSFFYIGATLIEPNDNTRPISHMDIRNHGLRSQ